MTDLVVTKGVHDLASVIGAKFAALEVESTSGQSFNEELASRVIALESGDYPEVNETVTKTLFVTVKTHTEKTITAVDAGESEPAEQETKYQIIHVPAFWPELSSDDGSSQSVGIIDNLPAIQSRLKKGGEQLNEVSNAN